MAANEAQAVQALFKRHFQQTPAHLAHAPAWLELLGCHHLCNDGLVLAVAVDPRIDIASTPRIDGKIELVSSSDPRRESFHIDDLKPNPAAPWADGVKAVLDQLRRRRVNFRGFNAALHRSIPAGMDPGAALAVATALTVRKLYPFTLTATGLAAPPLRDRQGELPPLGFAERLECARLCQTAVSQLPAAPRGLAGPLASLSGKAWNVLDIDCRAPSVELLPLPGEAIVVCESNVQLLPGGEGDEVRPHCEAAAKKLGASSLRTVERKQLEDHKSKLSPREYECARHVIDETARVVAAERALRVDDHGQFGQYLLQSHASSGEFLKNSTPALDRLIELARRHPGCLGARTAGPGGATLNLVKHHEAQSFGDYIQREFEKAHGAKLTPLICQIADGAQ